MSTLHEDGLTEQSKDMHRAIESLREELEAVDWYRQRAEATKNGALYKILYHNMKEEMEHAAMLIKWIRDNDHVFAEELKKVLDGKKTK